MFELHQETNIRKTSITETGSGADVEIVLSDAPTDDDVQEYLSFSVRVDYENYPVLEELKKLALQRVRDVITHEISRIDLIS